MAVNKPTSRQSRQAQDTQATQDNRVDDQQQEEERGSRFQRRTRFDPRPIVSRHGNTGDVAVIAEYFRKQIESVKDLDGDEVIVLDHKVSGGILSCILMCRSETIGNNKTAVTVHTYIMECSGGRLPKQISRSNSDRGFGGRQLEIDGVAGDVATKKMREERVMSVVRSHYGSAADIYPAGVSVVPRELASTDEKQLYQVFVDGIEAVHRTMDMVTGEVEPFNLQDVPSDMYVRAQVDINPPPLFDSTSMPIRSDIAIAISAINRNNNEENRYDASEIPLVIADAFIDVLYAKADQYQNPNQRTPQTYYANAVITRIGNPDGAMMLEYLGLGIHAMSLLNADMGWVRVFRQKVARENSWRDIGAVGWEAPHLDMDDDNPRAKPEPHQIDITSHNFSESRWFQLMGDAFHPGLIISIDIGETTGDSWLNGVLIDAAEGNDTAYQDVIDAFDNLTSNGFSKNFPVGEELFSTDNNRIAKGYWTSGDEKRSLDDLDYLAALNIWGSTDMTAVADWERTYSEKGGSLQSRIERRLRMQRHVFEAEGKMEVKGWAYRLTVNPEVVKALDKAIRATGVPIDLNDVGDNYGGFSRRSSSSLSRYVVDPRDVRPNYGRSRRDRDDDDGDQRGRSNSRGWSYRR